MNYVLIKNNVAVNVIVCASEAEAIEAGADSALELNDANMAEILVLDINNVVFPKTLPQ